MLKVVSQQLRCAFFGARLRSRTFFLMEQIIKPERIWKMKKAIRGVFLVVFTVSIVFTILFAVSLTVSANRSGDWEYSVSDGEATVTRYYGSGTVVTIPSKLGGYSVTCIQGYNDLGIFHGKNVSSVTIPNSVTNIGEKAFRFCTSLTNVNIPKSVTSIGTCAFENCTSLNNIAIPDSVISIGNGVFAYCSSLTSVTIPDSVTSIGDSAFYNCISLGKLALPDSVSSIGSDAFANCTVLTNITIPNGVTSIGSCAFSHCKSLTSVTIPSSVTSIGEKPFIECTSLETVFIDMETVPSAFSELTSIKSVILGDHVKNIGKSAFLGCTSLSNITIPDSVTSIKTKAFYNCGSLTDVTIPDSVKSIWSYAFYNCWSLTNVNIPDGVTGIWDHVFYGCSSLKSISIPDSVTSIEEYAFYHCTSLTSLTLPESLTSLGNNAFQTCSSLTSISLPNSLTSIGSSAFWDCTSLESVEISDIAAWCEISFANQYANPLNYAYNLYVNGNLVTDLVIPDGVTEIKSRAFQNCTSLKCVTIPSSVERIESSAFYGCSNLETVYFGYGLRFIRKYAFNGCSALESAYYTGSEDDWNRRVTIDTPNEYILGARLHFDYHFPVPIKVEPKAATCTENGNTEYWQCSVCGKLYSDEKCKNEISLETVIISALGHDYNDYVTAPTCTEEGYTNHICTLCGDSYIDSYVDALGHDFGKDGNTEKCSRCGEKNPNSKPTVNFKDVPDNAYYADAVAWAVANNITAGTSSTTFSPEDGCTRGQVVTFLWRAAGSPEPTGTKNPFRDVKSDAYYYKAVLWAVENGITSGTSSTTFSPGDVCTRGQIVTFLWRANGKPAPSKTSNPFKDVKASDYYYDAVLWAVEKGITLGTDATHFSPSDTCTRGQVVTFLYRAVKE